MRMPNKVNSFSNSVIALFAPILACLEKQDMTPHKLFEAAKTNSSDMSIFIDALNCLYKLGKVEIPEGTEVLRYVKTTDVR